MVSESSKKIKNSKIVRKKKRSLVSEHELEKLSSLSLEKENRSDLRINKILTPDKADSSSGYNLLVKYVRTDYHSASDYENK